MAAVVSENPSSAALTPIPHYYRRPWKQLAARHNLF
jgi:hypothetical protein